MRFFGESKVLRGSILWTKPLKLNVRVLPAQVPDAEIATTPELDEDGRIWVFRFTHTAPRTYDIDRDRLFAYMKHHRLPSETVRQIRRDMRNAVDFYGDVRDLQTPSEPHSL